MLPDHSHRDVCLEGPGESKLAREAGLPGVRSLSPSLVQTTAVLCICQTQPSVGPALLRFLTLLWQSKTLWLLIIPQDTAGPFPTTVLLMGRLEGLEPGEVCSSEASGESTEACMYAAGDESQEPLQRTRPKAAF